MYTCSKCNQSFDRFNTRDMEWIGLNREVIHITHNCPCCPHCGAINSYSIQNERGTTYVSASSMYFKSGQ